MEKSHTIETLAILRSQINGGSIVEKVFDEWYGYAMEALNELLEAGDPLLKKFNSIKYKLGYREKVQAAGKLLDKALVEYEEMLNELTSERWARGLPDGSWFHFALWLHVKHDVASGNWSSVVSTTVVFVEDRVRRRSSDPRNNNGGKLVGSDLFGRVFGPSGSLQLGDPTQASEMKGWFHICQGFGLALSNHGRHNLLRREDAKVYAIGVLGTASLILAQLDYQYGAIPRKRPRIGPQPWE